MATVFKNLLSNDVATTRTLLNEAIPITGTIVSGTYSDKNIKDYAHGMFQSVYDYPYLSSSANHIFDITYGYVSGSKAFNQNTKKLNIYSQMAQVLVGYDTEGNIRQFDRDGDLTGGDKLDKCVFINYGRLLTKDEIKKGSYTFQIGTSSRMVVGDYGAQNYYQAGIAVLTASYSVLQSSSYYEGTYAITGVADDVRERWIDNDFNNTTELNSTIYFCRVNNNEFNYSSNPTYLSSSKIVTKNVSSDPSVSYITTVGLYSADNELLAVAKLSEPLRKDQTNEVTLRVRLDY